MRTEYVSTGQAAKLCSVTADTVLKWVKKGKLQAIRTPGGHYRIPLRDVNALRSANGGQSINYCWEQKAGSGEIPDECADCLVYRSRALRCYELAQATREDYAALCACLGDCDTCEYHDLVKGLAATVVIVTPDPLLREALEESATRSPFNLRTVGSAYELSAAIEKSPPDFVVLDGDMGLEEATSIALHLQEDPRIRVSRIVLATDSGKMPKECEEGFLAHIAKPLSVERLEREFHELGLATW